MSASKLDFANSEISGLPQSSDEQMQVGLRIIDNAYRNRVESLMSENRALKAQMEEKAATVSSLQKRQSSLEAEVLEGKHRRQLLAEENGRLISTVKKLQKDVARLESVKQAILSSISEATSAEAEAAAADKEGGGQTGGADLYRNEEFVQLTAPATVRELRGDPLFAAYGGGGGNSHSRTSSPQRPPAQQPQTQPADPDMQGRMFFKAARARLSFEDFSTFLANIKRLNNHQQTREETLSSARAIFVVSSLCLSVCRPAGRPCKCGLAGGVPAALGKAFVRRGGGRSWKVPTVERGSQELKEEGKTK
uniref:At4g15545-like C-terminal domain-containing protein n=1 Tax=Chromera velia CCMP2878 TaxID=1169474 RepID=A0A0G4GHS1_9ALVE|eukprot:Cvel_21943.t1-p1 / transcript=Cvel_21943.t1 / gene=Cvel_21943 / organism=Chromera_velia_CCMP2878 / gene_product=Uncharacterized protein At4g15545, putative / transcript_product=Uncharacterized protein At4g15545, putative / location=Cvel_scaffold2106:19242-23736(-) / protein_length=307 / sequence_SO=supercontig / SO=protein_coding / is_pseudo=false